MMSSEKRVLDDVDPDLWIQMTNSEHCRYRSASPTLSMVESTQGDILQRHVHQFSSKKRLRNDILKQPEPKARCPIDGSVVAKLVIESKTCARTWDFFHQVSDRAKDYSFYSGTIKTVAHIVNMLFTEDMVPGSTLLSNAQEQFNTMCDRISELGTENWACDAICKAIVDLVSNGESYSALREYDVDSMLMDCLENRGTKCDYLPLYVVRPEPFRPVETRCSFGSYVSSILKGLDFSGSLPADDYTRILILIAQGQCVDVAVDLAGRVGKKFVDSNAWENLLQKMNNSPMPSFWMLHGDPSHIPTNLCSYAMDLLDSKIKYQLSVVTESFVKIGKSESVSIVDIYLLEVIEVAELRRHALGKRFISREHFVWAVYECGYGLPSNVNTNIVGEDRPPYHIYMTAVKLAASLGAKEMKLEHFIFAVLYAEDIVIDRERVAELCNNFKEFLAGATLDLSNRPRTSQRGNIDLDFLEGLLFDMDEQKTMTGNMEQDTVAFGSSM